MALKKVHIEDAWRHIEGQIIREHCNEPVASVDVCWDFLLCEMLVKIWQVNLCENLQLIAKDPESSLGQEIENLAKLVFA